MVSAVSRISSASSTSTNISRKIGDNSQKKSWQEPFSFQEICIATSNFSEQNKIGLGNFGTVYKGRLRDGSLVAVKRATKVCRRIPSTQERTCIFTKQLLATTRIQPFDAT